MFYSRYDFLFFIIWKKFGIMIIPFILCHFCNFLISRVICDVYPSASCIIYYHTFSNIIRIWQP